MDISPIDLSPRIGKIIIAVAISVLFGAALDYVGFKGIGWQLARGVFTKVVDEHMLESRQITPASQVLPADKIFWLSIKDGAAPALFEEFLRKYPASSHRVEAHARLDELRRANARGAQTETIIRPATPVLPSTRCVRFNGREECG